MNDRCLPPSEGRPPRPLHERGVRRDNVALVPGSLLPFKDEWQRVANRLPEGDTLVVVPRANTPLRRGMARMAARLRVRGHRIVVMDAERFGQLSSHRIPERAR